MFGIKNNSAVHVSEEEATHLHLRTEEIEAEKEQKRLEREQRKLERAQKLKSQFLEKLVAPIFLVVTILVSLVLVLLKKSS